MDTDYQNYHRDSDYRKYEEMFRNIFRKRFLLIEKFTGGKKVLEIGCSNGIFLDLFKENGWETWGVEPSKNAFVARNKGHNILNDVFENANFPKDTFDLVVMNHTMEHMENPGTVLKKIYNILKIGGVVFVDVPNYGSLLSKIMGSRWPYLLPKEHKWQFTKESLSRIFKEGGFQILHWESRSGVFEYAKPFRELRRKRFFLELLASPFSLLVNILNMGDSMSMIGRKT